MAKFVSAWLTPLPTQLPQHRFEPSIQGADVGHVTAPPDASCRRHLAPVERRDTGERGPRVEIRITDDPYSAEGRGDRDDPARGPERSDGGRPLARLAAPPGEDGGVHDPDEDSDRRTAASDEPRERMFVDIDTFDAIL